MSAVSLCLCQILSASGWSILESVIGNGCCTLAWWQLWNFIECQAKFNRFLYPNEHIQRIFWYLVRLFESELSKIGNFQSSDSFLEAKFHLIILKIIFSSEYQSRRTPFIKYICNLNNFHQSSFSKNVP